MCCFGTFSTLADNSNKVYLSFYPLDMHGDEMSDKILVSELLPDLAELYFYVKTTLFQYLSKVFQYI